MVILDDTGLQRDNEGRKKLDAQVLDPPIGADVTGFVASNRLLGLVKGAVENRVPFRIQSERNGSIIVIPEMDAFIADRESLSALCHLPRQAFSISPVGSAEVSSIVNGAARPLSELYWHAAYWACDGRLPEGRFRHDVIQLVRWPNLTRLPYDENFMRICALLSRHPSSVMLATRILKISDAEMNRFYCAAYHAGMVKVKNLRDPSLGPVSEMPPPSEPPPIASPKNASLLGKLFKRLVGL